MTSITWERRLDSAGSVEDVVATAREFLARLDPDEIESLPGKCRPPAKIVDADDVGMYAYELVRYECEDDDSAELVHRLARFFSHASMQVARVLAYERAARAAHAERAEESGAAASHPVSRVAS
jgi:hypothetical protein